MPKPVHVIGSTIWSRNGNTAELSAGITGLVVGGEVTNGVASEAGTPVASVFLLHSMNGLTTDTEVVV